MANTRLEESRLHEYSIISRHQENIWSSVFRIHKRIDVSRIAASWRCKGLMGKYGGQPDHSWEAVLRIVFSHSRLLVTMELADNKIAFSSQNASIEIDQSGRYRLRYLYSNFDNSEISNEEVYFGHCEILFSKDFRTASGTYFNNEKRNTFGKFELVRTSIA